MSVQILETDGLMLNKALSDHRAKALGALHGAETSIPPVIIDYIEALESAYLSLKCADVWRGLREVSWRQE